MSPTGFRTIDRTTTGDRTSSAGMVVQAESRRDVLRRFSEAEIVIFCGLFGRDEAAQAFGGRRVAEALQTLDGPDPALQRRLRLRDELRALSPGLEGSGHGRRPAEAVPRRRKPVVRRAA